MSQNSTDDEDKTIVIDVTQSTSRDKWGSPKEFILSCIGYSVGLGNVWRFPYLCYKNGGAAFLVVYIFLQLTIGKPMYFMELAMAQYSGKSVVRVWDLNPAARGIGLSMCIVSMNIGLYYNVIVAYILFYFFASFLPGLPWDSCDKSWPKSCFAEKDQEAARSLKHCPEPEMKTGLSKINKSCICTMDPNVDKYYDCLDLAIPSAKLYFERVVIQESDSLSDFGTPSWQLSLLLLLSWLIVLACMIKGIQTTGKVVYFSATFPYLILLILLGKGAMLDGAVDGVKFFILPKWEELKKLQLWIDAAGQMFFSLGLSMGGIMMFGSYNKFKHNVYRDAFIISSMDLITSILAGFVIFTTLGYMAKQTGTGILEVAQSSYGLAFVAYPETLTTLGWANFWSVLFFFMLFTLGLDSEFALVETLTTYLLDDIRWCRRHNVLLRCLLAIILFSLGLILVCPGGQYLIAIIDVYGSAYPLGLISLLECISVMWVYGVRNFMNDLDYMLGKKPPLLCFWYLVWVVWCPVFLTILLLVTLSRAETPKFGNGDHYGPGVMTGCWVLYAATLSPIPIWFFLHVRAMYRQHGFPGCKEFVKKVLAVGPRFGPADGAHPIATQRGTTVWADVLDWEVLKSSRYPPVRARTPPPSTEEVAGEVEDVPTTSAQAKEQGQGQGVGGREAEDVSVGVRPDEAGSPISHPLTDAERRKSHSVD